MQYKQNNLPTYQGIHVNKQSPCTITPQRAQVINYPTEKSPNTDRVQTNYQVPSKENKFVHKVTPKDANGKAVYQNDKNIYVQKQYNQPEKQQKHQQVIQKNYVSPTNDTKSQKQVYVEHPKKHVNNQVHQVVQKEYQKPALQVYKDSPNQNEGGTYTKKYYNNFVSPQKDPYAINQQNTQINANIANNGVEYHIVSKNQNDNTNRDNIKVQEISHDQNKYPYAQKPLQANYLSPQKQYTTTQLTNNVSPQNQYTNNKNNQLLINNLSPQKQYNQQILTNNQSPQKQQTTYQSPQTQYPSQLTNNLSPQKPYINANNTQLTNMLSPQKQQQYTPQQNPYQNIKTSPQEGIVSPQQYTYQNNQQQKQTSEHQNIQTYQSPQIKLKLVQCQDQQNLNYKSPQADQISASPQNYFQYASPQQNVYQASPSPNQNQGHFNYNNQPYTSPVKSPVKDFSKQAFAENQLKKVEYKDEKEQLHIQLSNHSRNYSDIGTGKFSQQYANHYNANPTFQSPSFVVSSQKHDGLLESHVDIVSNISSIRDRQYSNLNNGFIMSNHNILQSPSKWNQISPQKVYTAGNYNNILETIEEKKPLIDPSQFKNVLQNYGWNETDKLGQGSFGKVYKATNLHTGEHFALKQMTNQMFINKEMKESLQTEIQVMKKLNSANVVRMYDVILTDKETNLILELCLDGDLDGYLQKQGGRLTEERATAILFQILQGFKDLINHGYIHRDIKPANTLVQGEYFKLADFGFAAKVDVKSVLKEYVGSPLYMAPQLLENQPYSIKSDIWSIGLMFYEMLFGKTPWPARDVKSLRNSVKLLPLRFPYDIQIGKYTQNFIEGCLQKEEKDRFDWKDVFNHPIFFHSGEIQPKFYIDEKSKRIIREVQQTLMLKSLDLYTLFDKYDKENLGYLNKIQFYNMLHDIDPKVTYYEAEHVFKVFLKRNSVINEEQMQFDQFKAAITQYDFADLDDRATNILQDIKEIIKLNQIQLHKIFQQFDEDSNGDLDYMEFTRVMRSFVPGLKEEEIKLCFNRFDDDKNGRISYEEFYQTLSYGISHLHETYNPYREKAQKILKQILNITTKKNQTPSQLFQQFDKDNNQCLDLVEFSKLLKYIDDQLPQRDIQAVFHFFDENDDGSVQMHEFLQALQKK